jgi:hypothetical protein
MADLVVELLAVEECPHLEQARRDLESVLRTGIIEVPIQLVLVGSREDAEFLDFPGSPTIRINGDDVVPQPGLPVGLACRVYRGADGNALGSPPVGAIQSAVDAHRRDRLEQFQREEAAKVADFARAADAAELAHATGSAGEAELAREDEAAESSAESEGMPPEV